MLDASKTEIVLGPPGTGKTTKLIGMVRDDLKAGVRPDQIGFVSFTKIAAQDAATRASDVLGIDPADLRYFSTIHAMAKRQSGIQGSEVMGNGHLRELSHEVGFRITGRVNLEEGAVWGSDVGDRLMHVVNLARARCCSLREAWEDGNDDIEYVQVEYFADALRKYKERRQVRDFADMLDVFQASGVSPRLRHLFVDEAQDLSEQQWRCVEVLASHADRVTIAGDDDQLIYRFNGASLDRFLALQGRRVEVLGQSHRVPRSVQALAHAIISRVKARREKEWAARPTEGEVTFLADIDRIDMSQGTWLILARNRYLLEDARDVVHSDGYFYQYGAASSVKRPHYSAILSWQMLNEGTRINTLDAIELYDHLAMGPGFVRGSKAKLAALKDNRNLYLSLDDLRRDFGLVAEGPWTEALKIGAEEKAYYATCLARGETFSGTPRIKLATIHGTKGGEADNVVVLTDMAARTYREMSENGTEDDETRAFYVAVTRARQRLYVMEPRTPNHFSI